MTIADKGESPQIPKEAGKDFADLPVPQALLQPPDYFTGLKPELKNSNISSVIALGKWKIVAGEEVYIVDESGQFHSISEQLGVEDLPDVRTILDRALSFKSKNYIAFRSGTWNTLSVMQLAPFLKEIYPNINEEDIPPLVAKVKTTLIDKKVDLDYDGDAVRLLLVEKVIDHIEHDMNPSAKLLPLDESSFQVTYSPKANFVVTTAESISDWKSVKLHGEPIGTSRVTITTQGLTVRKYAQGKARLFDENNQQLLVLPDTEPALDPEDNSTIWIVDDGKIKSLDGEKITTGTYEYTEAQLPPEIGKCIAVNIDPHGNFLVVTHEGDNGKKIALLDKESLSLVEEIEGVSKPPIVDREGNVVFIDTNNQLRIVVTNFDHFPTGYGANIAEIQAQRLTELKAQIADLELPAIDPSTTQGAIGEEAMSGPDAATTALTQKLESMFEPLIKSATTENEIQIARLQLQEIMEKPEFSAYQGAASTIEHNFEIRTAQLRATKLEIDLQSLTAQIPTIKTLEGSLALSKELERIQLLRNETNLILIDPDKGKALQGQIKELEGKVQEIQLGFQGELVTSLTSSFGEVQALLSSAQTILEMEQITKDPTVRSYKEKLNLVSDPVKRTEIKRLYNTALETRQNEIQAVLSARSESMLARAAEIAADLEKTFKGLEQRIEALLQESGGKMNLKAWAAGSATVAEAKEQIHQLPLQYHEGYLNRIEELILTRQKAYQQQAAGTDKKDRKSKGATVKFGNESFPVYQVPLSSVTPGWVPLTKGMDSKTDKGELVFQSSTGQTWRTGEYMVMNMDDKQRKQKFESLRSAAELRFNPKRRVPELPDEMVLTASQEKTLETMAKLFRLQLGLNKNLVRERNPRGITIMQGDAGVGKDFSIEIIAALTNREIVSVPCRFSMDPEDITSEYRFNPEKGTFRVPSQFAQALSKPGTIINLIEINTMPPEVSKMLNSVFDYKRTLFFTQGADPDSVELNIEGLGQEIKINDDVIFVGTMNPENYIGTRPLPQEFKSRARIMDVDYPGYRVAVAANGEEIRIPVEQTSVPAGYEEIKILPDEAMMLAKQVDVLKSLTPDEFKKLWDHKINKDPGNGADMFDSPERSLAINSLNQIVRIANKMRQAYRAFQTNQPGAQVFEFVFSIRESLDIVAELVESGSVTEAIKEVILPKISDPEQKKLALAIIQTS